MACRDDGRVPKGEAFWEMKVTVELFGAVRYFDNRLSRATVHEISLAENATVRDALAALGLVTVPVQLALVTVNDRRATPDTPLKDGDTIRLVSPISGG